MRGHVWCLKYHGVVGDMGGRVYCSWSVCLIIVLRQGTTESPSVTHIILVVGRWLFGLRDRLIRTGKLGVVGKFLSHCVVRCESKLSE